MTPCVDMAEIISPYCPRWRALRADKKVRVLTDVAAESRNETLVAPKVGAGIRRFRLPSEVRWFCTPRPRVAPEVYKVVRVSIPIDSSNRTEGRAFQN